MFLIFLAKTNCTLFLCRPSRTVQCSSAKKTFKESGQRPGQPSRQKPTVEMYDKKSRFSSRKSRIFTDFLRLSMILSCCLAILFEFEGLVFLMLRQQVCPWIF